MTVPVVQVRSVRVIVRHRRMTVKVGMGLGSPLLPGLMDMVMVTVVMGVAVCVHVLRMTVGVPVCLGQEQEGSCPHERQGEQRTCCWALMQEHPGEQRSDEWSGAEKCSGSCGAQGAERSNEEGDAEAEADAPH